MELIGIILFGVLLWKILKFIKEGEEEDERVNQEKERVNQEKLLRREYWKESIRKHNENPDLYVSPYKEQESEGTVNANNPSPEILNEEPDRFFLDLQFPDNPGLVDDMVTIMKLFPPKDPNRIVTTKGGDKIRAKDDISEFLNEDDDDYVPDD